MTSSRTPDSSRPSPTIRGLFFDFGNVICTFDNRRILRALAPLCERTPEALETLIYGSSLPRAYESGAIDSRTFLEGLSALCGHAFDEATFIRAFTDIFTPIPTTFALLRRLKGRYRLGLISNTNPWHFQHGIQTTEVFPLFEAVTLSHEARALKPDPRIYRDALNKLGLDPGACVFIDDIPAFAEAATSLGMHGLVYTGPEALEADLARLGVEV
ncbi:hydrolase [Geothrix limicola]|uniref:Hydrolase n=1 Tax=Geothrix limicola TaxID=2927978 RepID=A0ABQ5QDR1_9BACT|nr:HAD family phosphatase [Geothrix limicola]GLH72724.1 hydrolase [Geothrix limicola]